MDDSDPRVAAFGLILAALVGSDARKERGVGGCWQSRGKLSRPSLETPSVTESLSAVLSLRSKYPACQFKASNICSEYLCFHIFITVIKCGTEMDGVRTTTCMAYKSTLEFPVNLVRAFFWTVGSQHLEKEKKNPTRGRTCNLHTEDRASGVSDCASLQTPLPGWTGQPSLLSWPRLPPNLAVRLQHHQPIPSRNKPLERKRNKV